MSSLKNASPGDIQAEFKRALRERWLAEDPGVFAKWLQDWLDEHELEDDTALNDWWLGGA